MKALILLLLSFSAFSQEFIQCEFEIRDNETKIDELKESKLSFLLKLNETEKVKQEIKLYKVRINPEHESEMYQHQILAFEMDANGPYKKVLDEKGIPFDIKDTGNKLIIDIDRVYQNMFVNMRTDFNYWQVSMGGPYTTKVTHEFNTLTPLYTEVYFEKIKKKLFSKDEKIVQRQVVPIYFSCQKLDTSYVIQTDLSEKANMIFSPLDETSTSKAIKN